MTAPALVAGELRGFRQFHLGEEGLYPLVHDTAGPWDSPVQIASCAVASGTGPAATVAPYPPHPAPAPGCRCGLYAWYLPGSATVAIGPASAVVAASGRCILGDRGFRAARARIEAVSLPAGVRWHPTRARVVRRMLAERYPGARVYTSTRRMLREHPPHDVRGLGIDPPTDRSRGYRTAIVLLGTVVPMLACLLAVLPREVAADIAAWWPVLLVATVAWQAGMVWLMTRLLVLQGAGTAPFGGTASAEVR